MKALIALVLLVCATLSWAGGEEPERGNGRFFLQRAVYSTFTSDRRTPDEHGSAGTSFLYAINGLGFEFYPASVIGIQLLFDAKGYKGFFAIHGIAGLSFHPIRSSFFDPYAQVGLGLNSYFHRWPDIAAVGFSARFGGGFNIHLGSFFIGIETSYRINSISEYFSETTSTKTTSSSSSYTVTTTTTSTSYAGYGINEFAVGILVGASF